MQLSSRHIFNKTYSQDKNFDKEVIEHSQKAIIFYAELQHYNVSCNYTANQRENNYKTRNK
jgi:hypothetical protein